MGNSSPGPCPCLTPINLTENQESRDWGEGRVFIFKLYGKILMISVPSCFGYYLFLDANIGRADSGS